MKKGLIASALALVMVLGLLTLVSCKGKETTNAYVTRGQWITMLADAFELDTYQESTPYYADIGNDNELFPYIQSTKEWNILSIYQDDTFNADTSVTRQEVASTAAFASGFRPNASSFDEKGQFVSKPSIDYAIAHGILEAKDLSSFMTTEECETVIELSRDLYLNSNGEEKISVIYNENLVDLKKVPPNFIDVNGSTITFLNAVSEGVTQDNAGILTASIRTLDGIAKVQEGSAFVTLPMKGQKAGAAYKVISIEETNRGIVFQTEPPTLGDLYDELVLQATFSLDESYITWSDNVTVSPVTPDNLSDNGKANEYHIELLSNHSNKNQATKVNTYNYGLNHTIKLGDGAIKILKGDNSELLAVSDAFQSLDFSNFTYKGTPSISDFIKPTESWTKKLTKEDKYSHGFSIEGNISLNLDVTPDIEYHKWSLFTHEIQTWPQSASLTVKSNIESDLKLEGSFSEEYEIGVISIPTSIAGLTIDGKLLLYVDLNGSVQAKVNLQNTNRVEWQLPLQFRHAEEDHSAHKSIQALVDSSFGPEITLSVCAYSIDIIGSNLKVSGNISATGTVGGECKEHSENGITTLEYMEYIRLQSDLYFPIISITAQGPEALADAFGVEKTWDIVGKNQTGHFPLQDFKYPFWWSTVTLDQNGEIVDTVETTPRDKLFASMQNGDFSYIAGTYTANMEYAQNYGFSSCPDIVITTDGVVTGGGLTSYGYTYEYVATSPISISKGEDNGWEKGTFECLIETVQGTFIPEAGIEDEGHSNFYIIYPPGISVQNDLTEDIDKIRIRYVIISGGVVDMVYTKVD